MFRVEDVPLLTGAAEFTRDIRVPGALHAVFVRSSVAHGSITSLDVASAAGAPGVSAVITAADLDLDPFNYYDMVPAVFGRHLLARDRVRTVGEPVAVVLAESAAAAQDAAELVDLSIEPEPAVIDPYEALDRGSVRLFHDAESNELLRYDKGRVPDLFDAARVVVSGQYPSQRIAPAPMECSAIVAQPTDEGGLDLWATVQGAHVAQDEIARATGMAPELIRVRAPAVGGGFGGRHSAVSELIVIAAVAHRLGRVVRWDESRTENLITMVHGRAQTYDVDIGFDDDGAIVGMRVFLVADTGAYPHFGPIMPFVCRKMACGPYVVPTVDFSFASVVTNTNVVGPYRGAGQPDLVLAIERSIDRAAARMAIDPVELRRRNLIPESAMPHTTAAGYTYDSGDYEAALDQALELVGYDRIRAEQRDRRCQGATIQLGIGLSTYVSVTASGGKEYGCVEIGPNGLIDVSTGSVSHGQSHASTMALVVSERLGAAPDAIRYHDGDTAIAPHGEGTGGSRTAQMAGGAVTNACLDIIEAARPIAARLLEADPGDIVVHDVDEGGLGVVGVPSSTITWSRLADEAGPGGLRAEVDFSSGGLTHPFGTHVSVVEVDTETGAVAVLTHVAVDDCGTQLNPTVVEGQQHGGAVAGISQALFEHVAYDENGQPRATSFADYLIPSAADVPFITVGATEVPSPHNPTGAKGIGENGAIAAPAAVQNAVVDALSHLGVDHIDLPLTPERVWRAINS